MKTYICAAHVGGQGKTTVSQAIYRVLRQRGEPFKLVSADFCDEQGRSKLGKFYPGKVTELGIGAQLTSAKIENDPNAALKYWDRFGEVLLQGGSVIDVGANVIAMLQQWAQHRNAHRVLAAKKASSIEILLVCKAEKHAVQDVAELVRSINEGSFVPFSGISIVQNEVGGNFDGIDVHKMVSEIAPKAHVRFLTLPRCTSELWGRMEQTYTSVEKALTLREQELAEILDIDIWSASAGLTDLKAWAGAIDQQIKRHLDLSRPLAEAPYVSRTNTAVAGGYLV